LEISLISSLQRRETDWRIGEKYLDLYNHPLPFVRGELEREFGAGKRKRGR